LYQFITVELTDVYLSTQLFSNHSDTSKVE